jgi:hypothetical protein
MNHRDTETQRRAEERKERGKSLILPLSVFVFSVSLCLCGETPKRLDPAAWGGDHVGKPLPEYVTGDQCLFCHRDDVGPSWATNRHHQTVREIEKEAPALASLKRSAKELAGDVRLVLGGGNRQRFLKQSEAYGKLDLLSAEWLPSRPGKEGRLVATDRPHWDARKFADGCAGCHTTGVDSEKRTFSAVGLDCYVCHGDAPLEHSKNASLVHLAKKRKDTAPVVTSICAQCHIRTGKSKSTGRPYPNNFVAGDNLFRDFQVDFSDEAIQRLGPADRHVLENVRDVVVFGKKDVTCLTCHDVHKQSAKKHHRVAPDDSCQHCHHPTGSKKVRKPYEVHSATCGY